MITQGPVSISLSIFIGTVVSWGLLELYISISRPFRSTAPSHYLIHVNRMLWLLFATYAWFDFKFELTRLHLSFGVLITLVVSYLLALILRISAVVYLGPSFSYDIQMPVSKSIVRSGPYRWIRHPSYLGICILGSLPGLILGSVIGFIGMLITTMIVIISRINHEEGQLENYFGHSFREYKKNTFRLIPFFY